MNVVCCQMNSVWEDRAASIANARQLLADAARLPDGSLIVLPEMFATGFSMNLSATIETYSSEAEAFLAETARTYRSHVIGGVVRAGRDGLGRNEAAVFAPDGTLTCRYCKMHPFTLGGETGRYEPGDSPCVFTAHDFTIAPFICYDLRFPEIFRDATGRQGAEVIVVIANWPVARIAHWVSLLTARAIENQAFVVGVNRVGSDPTLQYPGRSLVIAPDGNILADAGDTEQVTQTRLDREFLQDYRRRLPFLADRRRAG